MDKENASLPDLGDMGHNAATLTQHLTDLGLDGENLLKLYGSAIIGLLGVHPDKKCAGLLIKDLINKLEDFEEYLNCYQMKT